MVQLGRYAALSAGSALAIIIHAFRSREQFYPAMLYLATSKISLVVLLNMGLVLMCILWQAIKTVFLGSLREAEVERLNEQSWREVMEILFAMTIFREEFNVTFVAMITVLLFIKAFHWLAQKRVEYIETTPSVSRLSHFRIITFMALLLALDMFFLHFSVAHLLRTRKASVSLFFAFEYMILATSTVATFLKYVLYVGDMVMEGQWDNKAVYIFYLELVRDLLHLSLYLFFFLVIFIHYGLPLHLVRELYETFRNFKARVADFIRYRKITSNMNDRFPDATEEELGRSDATCIICREEMTAAKKLPCGHFFHVHCLRSWLERQQTCPTCRAPVSAPEPTPASATEAPAAHQHGVQQDQPPVEGQAGVAERRPYVLVQWPGAGPSPYMRQPPFMQATATPNNQPRPAVTGLAVQHGMMAWCPVYIPMIPQGHMIAPGGAPQTGQASDSSGPGNEAGVSGTSDGQSNSNQQHPLHSQSPAAAQSFNSSLQFCQMYMQGYVPLAAFAPPQQPQDAQAPPASADSEHQTGPSTRDSTPPSLLQIQLAQLAQYIEAMQKQLQALTLLQRQLSTITPETTAAASPSESSQTETVETSATPTSDKVDVKGKSPVDVKEEEIRPSSSVGAPASSRIHDLASLLSVEEQGMVTSPPAVPEESDITQRSSISQSDEPGEGTLS